MGIETSAIQDGPWAPGYLSGVIEGFYGPPWNQVERNEMLEWLRDEGLNTYFYAPKDDLKHRARWRELYSEPELAMLGELISGGRSRGVELIYGLAPGLDIRYSEASELTCLQRRIDQLQRLGFHHFAVLFDDIPDRMNAADRARFGTFASAQAQVTNWLSEWANSNGRSGRFYFCPTPYCGRMAERQLGGPNYRETIGRELAAAIGVFWTGPEIISSEVSVAHVREVGQIFRRKPILWDNLHANDYDGRRMYLGPYAGRAPELRAELGGILLNPNTEFPLNFVALQTFAEYLRSPGAWDARAAYLRALRKWSSRWVTHAQSVEFDQLVLFADCFYLPTEEGPEASSLWTSLRGLLAQAPSEWGEGGELIRTSLLQLRDFCARITELSDRPLFYALSRRAWELREEMDLLATYLRIKAEDPHASGRSDFHLPGTYRGGFVPRLQQLLRPNSDGTFTPDRGLIR